MPKLIEFERYIKELCEALGHRDRHGGFADYCRGLMLPGERKSVEPMAARLDPAQVPSLHQALHHFVATAAWRDAAVLAGVREQVLPALTRHGPITAWIIDDTSFPKKGRHSVGVARQYCGQLGKQENCQVAVSLSVANDRASLPIAFELYLPEDWAGDPARRTKAGVPEDLGFRTKPQIALAQIRARLADGVPPGVILGDAGYGIDTDFRTALSELALVYVLGVQSSLGVWPPGCGPLPPKPWSGKGRPPKLWRRDAEHQPVTAKDLALPCRPALADGELAGRQKRRAGGALCCRAGAAVAPRLLACRAARRGMAADRVAGRKEGAEQVLAVDPAGDDHPCRPGRHRQDALADRAGLPGAEAGTGPRPL